MRHGESREIDVPAEIAEERQVRAGILGVGRDGRLARHDALFQPREPGRAIALASRVDGLARGERCGGKRPRSVVGGRR